MGNILAYSGIVTKIRAMEAKLLTPAQFEEIANLSNVLEVVSYLKEHSAYTEVLSALDDDKLHRGNIEKVLIQSLYHDYSKIYRFCGQTQRRFLKLYLKRYEIDLINYCLRIVINHYRQPFDLYYKKAFFDHYSQISIEKLVTSRTTDELIENLKDTEYYAPLKKIQESQHISLFDYELTLDLYYFSTLWKERKKVLKKSDLELFTKDCGSKIDLLNLQWIYRAKKYYQIQPADIYLMLIPIQYKIHVAQMKELVETASLEEFMQALEKTSYARHYNFKQNLTIEQMYNECLHRLYLIDRRRNPYSIAAINTYLFLKEEELNKLTTAMECIRYSLTPGETLAYIGGRTQ
ncbi:V-type ATPase subunit [Faecalicatena acetigenes]|uniref:V-type ATPase subunit n=1 Tax=Faecalicatena acetigenes TaxID=2981790 RepID=A0ABT2T7B4_9FIRM|nr:MULTISPECIES: V-type ATPase subunit [Lachnospiraceae]MCU6746147.1 V-type ATPase subunit [Faecalicatena acetigenes]SCG97976.1 V-type ATP synthase subunit C [uncultured Clostridium sp.]